jgi:hypothetical protein
MIDWEKESAHVVLKFHYGQRGSVNSLISKTMGRVAVISHGYEGPMPQNKSFWLCKIEKEHGSGQQNGCYIVVPVKEVKLEQIMKLVPGAYETEIIGATVMCRPRVDGHYWIIPFSLKKFFIKKGKADVQYQSIVVPLKLSA